MGIIDIISYIKQKSKTNVLGLFRKVK